ncbi:hypothetical protein SAMN04487851_11431 [Prevotella sp. tc2-28]|uniref:hypothetical protein n=1 Tax=Prevotella sp. tc2-28 TaxID=1761888 RepID=UPI00089972C4|nr:hypothetical protein [Prevotella sp. tc2-28]SEA78988.1 hypothetical protein SAMN04487851_11431 [Prevotella sp. tc2-28]
MITQRSYSYWFLKTYGRDGYYNNGCSGPMIAMMILLLFLLCGCKSVQYIPVETVKTEYVTKTDTFIQKDSVLVKDSVFIHSKGDTVWYEKWHTKYIDRWKERVVVDSFIKTDSIRTPYPVERNLNKWEQFCLDFGKVTTGVTIAVIIAAIVMMIRWIRRKIIS